MKTLRYVIPALCLLCLAVPTLAQRRSSAKAGVNRMGAPIPDPLLHGQRAFISYEMGDVTDFPSHYSGGPERAYSEFYAQMNQWGHFTLVNDPAQADVIFAIRFVDPPQVVAQIRLGILDARTHTSLWGFVEQVDGAIFKNHRDDKFSTSIARLVDDVKLLLDPSAAAAPTTKP